MVMLSVNWLNSDSSSSSGGGWGAFTPNVGSFGSGGSWGSSGLGGFGTSFGGDFGDLGGGVARTFDQVGGGGGGSDRGGNRYDANGFGIANESTPGDAQHSGGTQQTMNTPVTDLGRVQVVARRPDSTYTGDQTRRNIQGLFDPSATAPTDLGTRVVVTARRPNSHGSPSTIPFNPNIPWMNTVTVTAPYDPPGRPYDPSVKTLDRLTAVKPSQDELDAYNESAVKETLRRDQRWMFSSFTGELGAAYSGLKALFNRDWWGATWSGLGLAGLGLGPTLRLGGKVIRNSSLAGDVHPITGIPYKQTGFADFSDVAVKETRITRTGKYSIDETAANLAAGFKSTPRGYTWHHVEDGTTMQLVPRYIHSKTGHTGGVSLTRARE